MTDKEVAAALAPGSDALAPAIRSQLAAVRSFQGSSGSAAAAAVVFTRVRIELDSARVLAGMAQGAAASGMAFDAYMTFEQIENAVRVKNSVLADQLEAAFAAYRARAAGDNGNDWLVGGTYYDWLFGGWGDDLLNLDDYLDTNNGLNDRIEDDERFRQATSPSAAPAGTY